MTNENKLGDAPIQSEFNHRMNNLAHFLDEMFNDNAEGEARKTGFILIVFPFEQAESAKRGGTGRANYISNAKRSDVVIMLKEQIKRFEGQPEMEGNA